MGNMLSQEEIDALLKDSIPTTSHFRSVNNNAEDILSITEIDTLGEIANISMGAAATTLSSLLNKRVKITTPQVTISSYEDIRREHQDKYVVIDVDFTSGLMGANVFIINSYDAGVIVDLMMGGDGTNPSTELNELHLSAVSEAMNQMMGSSATSLSQLLNKRINISPPMLDMMHLHEHAKIANAEDHVVAISFRVEIQGLLESKMLQLLPIDFACEMVEDLIKGSFPKSKPVSSVKTSIPHRIETEVREKIQPQVEVSVAPLQFSQLVDEQRQESSALNLDLIMDVELKLTVELGRTSKRVKDILELAQGSVIELDKLAGEPVDILVNNKLLAKGEVVVIDENFGVRVIEIISPLDRVNSLK